MTTTSAHTQSSHTSSLRLARPQLHRNPPQRWQDILIVGWFFLLPWLHFWRLWFGLPKERSFVAWNFFETRWPQFQSAVNSLFSGNWVQWDPYLAGGWPIAAETSLGLYSPSHWPYLAYYALFREHSFFAFESLLMWQLALAGCGMYLYLRSLQLDKRAALVGGTVFVIAGLSPLFYGTHLFASVLWFPWVLWALESFLKQPTLKSATWFALFLSFSQLGGSPSGFFLLVVGSFFYIFFRFLWDGIEAPPRTFLWLSYALCLVALWGAVLWLPYLELATVLPPHRTHVHTFPSTRIWGLLSPFYGNHLYHGILLLPLVLAAWLGGQQRRLWWTCVTLAVWGMLFALWPHVRAWDPTPQYLFTSSYITSRPDRYLALISPAFCILIALGVQSILTPHPRNWQREFLFLLSILWGFGLLVLLGVSLWSIKHQNFTTGRETQAFQQWAICGGMLYCLYHFKKRGAWGWAILLVLFFWLDIAPHTRQSGLRGLGEYRTRQGGVLVTLSPEKQRHQRIFNSFDEAPQLASALFQLRALEGLEEPRQTYRDKAVFGVIKKQPHVLRVFNVSHVLLAEHGNHLFHRRFFNNPRLLQRSYRATYTYNKTTLHESRSPIAARIQWLPRWRVVKHWREASGLLPKLNPICEAVLERSKDTPPAPQPKPQKFPYIPPKPPKKRVKHIFRAIPRGRNQHKVRFLFPRVPKATSRPASTSKPTLASRPTSTSRPAIAKRPVVRAKQPTHRTPSQPRMVVRFVLPSCPNQAIAAKIKYADAQTILAEIEAPADGIVLINERYWNGWSATLDNKPVPLLRANILMQAIRVSKGRHTLRLHYRSRIASLGFSLWGLAWLIALAIFAMTTLWGDPVQTRERP
ncbi:MAG: hypothetical protein H6728_04290 [Myxococcales bacterium]|nr:hypothetical protein [Myxococcales bacterium]